MGGIPGSSLQLRGHEQVTYDLSFNFLIFEIKYFTKNFPQESHRFFHQPSLCGASSPIEVKGGSVFTAMFLGWVLAELSCVIDKFDLILALYGKGRVFLTF